MRILRDVSGLVPVLLAALSLGCASEPWPDVVAKDSPASYRSFLLEYPNSEHAEEARARIEFHKLMREPSLAGYVAFREEFPESGLYSELRPSVEPQAFERARFSGTAEAYAEFLEVFPDGAFADRARGNRVFLEAGGYTADAPGLGDFAAAHPESDYAPEALRSFETYSGRSASRFHRVGLEIRISRGSPEVGRLEEAFAERAAQQYAAAGLELVVVPESPGAGAAVDVPVARLLIEHAELPDETKGIGRGSSSQPALLAMTRVSLRRDPQSPPIWSREFTLRLDAAAPAENQSMLFTREGATFWDEFFVPVATWRSDLALRDPIASERGVVDVDAVGDRVVVLFDDGSFRVLELTNPSEPLILAEYWHAEDGTHWQGVRIHGDRVHLFGADGLEVVRFGAQGPERVSIRERPDYGAVLAVEPMNEGLLVATQRGLFLTDRQGGEARQLVRRKLRGMAVVGETVVFADGEAVYVSSMPLLEKQRVTGKLKLGREFDPGPVLAFGSDVVALGGGGALFVDLRDPSNPRVRSRVASADVGRISDVARVRGRFFLLGDRGLQLLDRSGRQVVESVDVATRQRVVRMGRHLVTAGPDAVQLVDGTPFTAPEQPDELAAPAP